MTSATATGEAKEAAITDEQIEAHDEMLRHYRRVVHVPQRCRDIEKSIAHLRNDPALRPKFAKYDWELSCVQEELKIVRDHFAKDDLPLAQFALNEVEIHFQGILRRVSEPDRKRGAKQIAFAREGGRAKTTIERDKRLARLFLQRMDLLGEGEKRRKTAIMGKIAEEKGLRVDACRKAIQRGLKTLGENLRTTRANSPK